MARGDLVKTRLLERIALSQTSLAVHYPAVRVPASGAVNTPPVSPLTGPSQPSRLAPAAETPSKPPVEGVKCLWLDTPANMQITSDRLRAAAVGYVEGAHAMVRVAVSYPGCGPDAALDPDDPYAGTIFDGCEYVEYHGKHYRVLQVDLMGGSGNVPYSYSVWLSGAGKE